MIMIWRFIAELFRQLLQWPARLFRRPERRYVVEYVDDEPDRYAPGVLYVIVDAGRAWTAAMACPEGCGKPLHMNLLPDTKPVWRLTLDADEAPTLAPSVWRREGCGCHFFLRRGRIEWC